MSGLGKKRRDQLADKFIVKKVTGLADGELKGSGAYGLVREVSVGGTACIAKRIHDILQDPRVPPDDRESVKDKFYKECKMLSELRHPNIVHFVGVHYGKRRDLTLIMEMLHSDLRDFFLQKEPTSVTLSVKLGILLDVSYGLLYLHSQQPTGIIHRDLNPGNVLLTRDLRAKIADLGVSQYLSISKAQSMAPGAWDYMPPEAMRENPTYDTSLDVFSFGHITLCVGNHCTLDIALPSLGESSQSSIKRRKRYLDSLGHKHGSCMRSLAVDCLQDEPSKRPATRELCDRLQKLCRDCPRSSEDVLKVAELPNTSESKPGDHFTSTDEEQPSSNSDPSYIQSTESDDESSSHVLSPSSNMWWYPDSSTCEETSSSLQQRIDELIAENKELKNNVDAEKARAQVYKEDFNTERSDREKAHKAIDNYKFQLTKLQEKFTQIEKEHQHERAQMHVLKAATARQAEELRKLRSERSAYQLQKFGNAPNLPLFPMNEQVRMDQRKPPPGSYVPAVNSSAFVHPNSPTTSSSPSGGVNTSPLSPPLPPKSFSHLHPANSFYDFKGTSDNYEFPGHEYEEIR